MRYSSLNAFVARAACVCVARWVGGFGGLGGLGFGPEVWVEGLVVQVPGCNLPRSPGTFASPRKWSEGARPQLPDLLARTPLCKCMTDIS